MFKTCEIKNELNKYQVNELIFASKLYKEKFYNKVNEATYYKCLERMHNQGELFKISKGVYFFPNITKYGVIPPPSEKIINLFTKNNHGMVIGYSLYNYLNLTTQISKKIDVISSLIEQKSKTIGNISVHKVNINYSKENVAIIQLLDVLQNFYSIEDINYNAFIKFVKNNIRFYNDKIFNNVIQCISFKKSTIAFLQNILNFYDIKNNLNNYLSSLSQYNYPDVKKINESAR